jgi:ABC-2 type transport system permease protein
MTSKTSLFNKGIFKSTLRRYMWGAVLYSIILFMTTSLVILLGVDKDDSWYLMAERGTPLILDNFYLFIPVIISCFVPTIVALLVYRFLHSKKTSVFVHSLPVSRTANYISTVLAALTLMAAPIIINGIILVILSLGGYGGFFDVTSCLIWTGVNLLTIFLMFSISTFAANLTGNSFAVVGLNGLIHCIAIILAGAFSALASCFIYGYCEVNALLNKSTEWNFVAYVIKISNDLGFKKAPDFDWLRLVIMIALAAVFYIFGWLLYKKRRMETAEDVAAFKCLNPIYKYLVTFVASLGSFAIFSYMMGERPIVPIIVTAIVSFVVYFAAEMILRKSFKVWNRYKGYLVFAAAFCGMICIFAFTGFFGYETRVPDISKIDSVAIYEYYYQADAPWLDNEDVKAYTLAVHKEMVEKENIYIIKEHRENYNYNTAMHIRYKLKNGKTMVRRYPINQVESYEILENLYKFDDYKRRVVELFDTDMGEIYNIGFNHNNVLFNGSEKIKEFYSCLEEDIMSLDYSQMYGGNLWSMNVSIEYVPKSASEREEYERYINNMYLSINANYKKSIQWIRDNGFEDQLFNRANRDLCVLTKEDWEEYTTAEEHFTASYGKGGAVQSYRIKTFSEITGIQRITDVETKKSIADFVTNKGVRFVPDKEFSYYVCAINEAEHLEVEAAFYEDGAGILELIK